MHVSAAVCVACAKGPNAAARASLRQCRIAVQGNHDSGVPQFAQHKAAAHNGSNDAAYPFGSRRRPPLVSGTAFVAKDANQARSLVQGPGRPELPLKSTAQARERRAA